jgi:hypothetical protein
MCQKRRPAGSDRRRPHTLSLLLEDPTGARLRMSPKRLTKTDAPDQRDLAIPVEDVYDKSDGSPVERYQGVRNALRSL